MNASIKDGIGAFLLGAASGLAVNVWFSLLAITEKSEAYQRTAQAQFSQPLFTGLLLYGVLAPVLEELIFRRLLYKKIRQYYGIAAGLLISSVLFGVYHGNWVQGIYGTLLGFLIAWIYEKCGSFPAPVLVHGGANMAVYLAVFFPAVRNLLFTYPGGVLLSFAAAGLYLIFFTDRKPLK